MAKITQDEKSQNNKDWYEQNKETKKKKSLKYYYDNKDEILENQKTLRKLFKKTIQNN